MEGYLILSVLLLFVVLGITAFIDAFRHPAYAWKAIDRSRAGTAVGVLCSLGIGGLYYWLVLRGRVVRAERTTSPPGPTNVKDDPWAEDDGW